MTEAHGGEFVAVIGGGDDGGCGRRERCYSGFRRPRFSVSATPDVLYVYTIETIKRVSSCARRFALATGTLGRKRYVRTRSPSCVHGRSDHLERFT
jgi:hypothetical protein